MNKSSQKQSKSAERNELSLSEPAEKNMHPPCAAKKSSKQGIHDWDSETYRKN